MFFEFPSQKKTKKKQQKQKNQKKNGHKREVINNNISELKEARTVSYF